MADGQLSPEITPTLDGVARPPGGPEHRLAVARPARISSDRPVGRALSGRRAGEVVWVEMPGGGVEPWVDEVRPAA